MKPGQGGQSQGTTLEDFKLNMKNGMITQKVIGSEVGRHLTLQGRYTEVLRATQDQFAQTEQVRMSELLVSTQKMG